jgi:hypothetical protein
MLAPLFCVSQTIFGVIYQQPTILLQEPSPFYHVDLKNWPILMLLELHVISFKLCTSKKWIMSQRIECALGPFLTRRRRFHASFVSGMSPCYWTDHSFVIVEPRNVRVYVAARPWLLSRSTIQNGRDLAITTYLRVGGYIG